MGNRCPCFGKGKEYEEKPEKVSKISTKQEMEMKSFELRKTGNDFFKQNKFAEAINMYSEALVQFSFWTL